MSHSTDEYEFARKIVKREKKNPNVYSENRKKAILERVHKEHGAKAASELAKEFKL